MADQNIALGVQVPDGMKNISGMLNFAGQAQTLRNQNQEYERGNIQLQKERQANEERVAVQQFMSNPDNYHTQDGRIDIDKLNATIPKIAPLTGPDVISKLTSLATAQTQATEAKQRLTQSQRAIVAGPLGILGRQGIADGSVYQKELDELKKTNPDNPELHRLIDAYKSVFKGMPTGNKAIADQAIRSSQSLMSPETQQADLSPKAGFQSTGGALAETINQPAVGGNAPSMTMTGQTTPLTLPPTATRFNTQTGAPEYVGQPAGGSPAPVQSAPALGQPEAASGTAANMTTDWRAIQESASKAAQDVGVLQEIKKYANGAVTGVESERRAYLTGLAGLIGMTPEQLEKTNTDLLAKNSAMIALAGGDTNLARTMAESANPNVHMTAPAIHKAADQVIAQRQISLARQKFLQPFISDPIAYSRAVTQFNQIADPRVLQLESMSKEEKAQMKAAMSPAEQKAFGDKIRAFYQLGILK